MIDIYDIDDPDGLHAVPEGLPKVESGILLHRVRQWYFEKIKKCTVESVHQEKAFGTPGMMTSIVYKTPNGERFELEIY
jgi:hypothetical protein